MKVSAVCFLIVALLSPTSVDLVAELPDNNVKTKWLLALEDSDIIFADGIKASLKKGSKLIHPETFSGKSIDITLLGEGSFQVSDGYHLVVRYNEVIVAASGVSFSITKAPRTIEVIAHDNQIVITAGDRQIIISSFQKAIYDSLSKRFTVIDARIQMT